MKPTFDHLRQLTDPDGRRDSIASSYEGMAHFAGTGPEEARCRHCQHWNNGRSRKSGAREITKAVCARFVELTKVRTKPVPGEAAACKWFEPFVERLVR